MSITHDAGLLWLAGLTVLGLIVLVTAFKVPAFVALILASLSVGLCTGRSPSQVTTSFAEGVGSVLGSTAMILALGAILGKALAVSGGARQLGIALIEVFRGRWTPLAVACAAFLIGMPVFFSAGLVLLIPLVSSAARERRVPLVSYGLPMVAGLSVAHGLVPPHPGPIAAVGILHADLGKTLLYSVAVGLPVSLIAGVVFAPILARNTTIGAAEMEDTGVSTAPNQPRSGLGVPLTIILTPITLMFMAVVADFCLPRASALHRAADCLGTPLVAMLLGALFSLWSLARHPGLNRDELAKLAEECLAPVGSILLVVGAGGGFSRVLIDSGVSSVVAAQAGVSHISPLLLGWLIAAFIRIATGSATVAITTASGLMAPIAATNPALNRELLVLAMGSGSLVCSHVNDGGFWLVKEYLNLSVTQTLKTWTILETAISLLGLALVQLLNFIV